MPQGLPPRTKASMRRIPISYINCPSEELGGAGDGLLIRSHNVC